MSHKVGIDCAVARNTGTFSSPTLNEIQRIRDVSIPLTAGEVDVSSRASVWKTYIAGMLDLGLEFEMTYFRGDEDIVALRTAFLARTPIELFILDGRPSVAGSTGIRAAFSIFDFSSEEPLEDGKVISISLKPTPTTDLPAPVDYTVPS